MVTITIMIMIMIIITIPTARRIEPCAGVACSTPT
jgi:hypothetical protein